MANSRHPERFVSTVSFLGGGFKYFLLSSLPGEMIQSFHVQRRFLWNFCGVFQCEWATQELLHALLCVLLMECVVCTPWGVKYKRHSRIALSGAYIVQTMESWFSTLLVMRTCLDLALNSPERSWPIRRFGVLADDIHIHVLRIYVERFRKALIDNAMYLDYQLKDNIVTAGSATCFTWLGFGIWFPFVYPVAHQ